MNTNCFLGFLSYTLQQISSRVRVWYEIWGNHSCFYEGASLLGCYAVPFL